MNETTAVKLIAKLAKSPEATVRANPRQQAGIASLRLKPAEVAKFREAVEALKALPTWDA